MSETEQVTKRKPDGGRYFPTGDDRLNVGEIVAKDKLVPVIVTTAHKGVFFGYGTPSDAKSIRIERVRMVVYWSADVRGIVGLAATGPTAGCRVGLQAPAVTLLDVTGVIEVSPDAAKRFEEAPWSK